MKKFVEPTVEIINISAVDVITASEEWEVSVPEGGDNLD
jgi:hypothetical protein